MKNPEPRKLTSREVIERWGNAVTEGTLNNWRHKKKGPPYIKFGTRVRYPEDKLADWEASQEHLAPANDNTEAAERAA
ncbi:helix-turn-helix transcriptional regulator [Tardiphaga sp. 20_F10_N6_6]|uniref:helix-turn-helix transcriptional regulator n=1 Tax=Tardiphaga sp. 20_F10_N6_6 TaxID=3240788 RepID=UPI003F8A612E